MTRRPAPQPVLSALRSVLAIEPLDLTEAALVIAQLEYPHLDPQPYRDELDRLGRRARVRFDDPGHESPRARIAVMNALLFGERGLAGNQERYEDVRNSFINEVLDRRTGIPITLALIYIEVARRAGWTVHGVSFPGHFLLRVPGGGDADLLLDPFADGAELSTDDCRQLLARQLGAKEPDDAVLDPGLLVTCTPRHMVARMLNNLKRAYIDQHDFPRARLVTDLTLAVEPTRLSEIRDRGLMAGHLDDNAAALRDLEDYLRLNAWTDAEDGPDREERDRIGEQITMLKRRLAGMN